MNDKTIFVSALNEYSIMKNSKVSSLYVLTA